MVRKQYIFTIPFFFLIADLKNFSVGFKLIIQQKNVDALGDIKLTAACFVVNAALRC